MTTEHVARRIPLSTKILLGLLVGAVLGIGSNLLWHGSPRLIWIADNVANPLGQVFLRLLFMVVVPLIFTSLALGVASLGDLRKLGRIGGRTLLMFVVTTAMAATIGIAMMNLTRPGERMDAATREQLMAEYAPQASEKAALSQANEFGISTLVNIVPRNPIAAAANGDTLALIFFTLIFGVALTRISPERAAPVIRVLEGIGDAVMAIIELTMRLAPIGVAGLIFSVTAKFGLDVLKALAAYVIVVLAALIIHQFVVIGALAKVLAGQPVGQFFAKCKTLMITGFSTSSSNATLPTTIRTAEENFGVPPEIAGFVLPLGATMNMNGTALFEGMTVLFLAQVFGVHLSLASQVLVVGMSVITAIGVAGVPSGSIPLLIMVMEMVGVPGAGIALILGVDRILDMSRTVPNVTGDLLTSLVIARGEKSDTA